MLLIKSLGAQPRSRLWRIHPRSSDERLTVTAMMRGILVHAHDGFVSLSGEMPAGSPLLRTLSVMLFQSVFDGVKKRS